MTGKRSSSRFRSSQKTRYKLVWECWYTGESGLYQCRIFDNLIAALAFKFSFRHVKAKVRPSIRKEVL